MKRKQRIAFLAMVPAILLTTICSISQAQTNVAIVDVGQIFKSHPQFDRQLQQLKAEADQFKANSMQLREEMVAKSEQLNAFTPDSEEFKNAETMLAQELAKLEVEQRNAMRKLMQREAKLHFDTYQQVKQTVTDYCAEKGFRLVLRHSTLELDIDNPNSIMQEVNNNIVFFSPGRDITGAIIQKLNGTASLPGNTQR